jgi:hypothetical protein
MRDKLAAACSLFAATPMLATPEKMIAAAAWLASLALPAAIIADTFR